MYKPYLRGKLNEMLALRELSDIISNKKNKISPIIEPVTKSSSFKISLKFLVERNINFTIVVNPKVGVFKDDNNSLFTLLGDTLLNYNNYQLGIIVENNINSQSIIHEINQNNLTPIGFTIIHNTIDQGYLAEIQNLTNYLPIIYNVVNLNKTLADRNYIQNFHQNTRISLVDYFKSQTKNSLYLDYPDSTFSNDYANFSASGNFGFGDYLTVGDKFADTGASPYAVAIHISYLAGQTINVKHFASDSNNDQSDPGGKFFEANVKLVEWCNLNGINTLGSNGFRQLQINQHYPGLGTLKKLSIMNHIELIISLI